jgi:hypothetical protein
MLNKAEKLYQEALAKIKSKKRVPILKVIRLKCLDCCCWQENEVRLCPSDDCILWNFRMGKNPIKREMTEEQRDVLRKRMKKSLVAKSSTVK